MTGLRQMVGDAPRPAVVPYFVEGQQGVMQAVWDTTEPMPTKASPQLALVLVPKDESDDRRPVLRNHRHPGHHLDPGLGGRGRPRHRRCRSTQHHHDDDRGPGLGVPVREAAGAGARDNQALAVNTTDGTTEYEAAFALVWVTDEDAMNVNEAQAYASCTSCAAVAVAFQVVFGLDTDETDDNVAAPQNLAGALNYNCVNCLTYALAQQLFVTLHGPLSDEAMAALDELWAQIASYGDAIAAGEVPVNEIAAQLEQYKNEILAIVETDQPGTLPSTSASSSTAASGSASPSASGLASPSASASALPQGTTTTDSSTGTTAPSGTTTDSPSGTTSGTTDPAGSPTGTATTDGTSSSPTPSPDATSPTASPTADATTSSSSTDASPTG